LNGGVHPFTLEGFVKMSFAIASKVRFLSVALLLGGLGIPAARAANDEGTFQGEVLVVPPYAYLSGNGQGTLGAFEILAVHEIAPHPQDPTKFRITGRAWLTTDQGVLEGAYTGSGRFTPAGAVEDRIILRVDGDLSLGAYAGSSGMLKIESTTLFSGFGIPSPFAAEFLGKVKLKDQP